MSSVWWLRRDLRLTDNPALMASLRAGAVIPVFILDPRLLDGAAPPRRDFLFAGLKRLDDDLRKRGSRLHIRSGDPADALRRLLAESGAQMVFAEEDFTPYARRRDERVGRSLPLALVHGQTVHHPARLLKPDGRPYTVFTPYSKRWKSEMGSPELSDAPEHIPTPEGLTSEPMPPFREHPAFPAGEAEAVLRLEEFTGRRILHYDRDRDRLDLEGASGLSPYFHFGMLSLRRAAALAIQTGRPGQWLNELIWREFYIQILYHFPRVRREAFQPSLAGIPWNEDVSDLEAWQQGRTGVPVVDAAMRQLLQTGWMHNRARMIAASYLVKDLLIDWRQGERWFMERLIDGDIAANNGGWQWTAGTGTDAAPYFRIFNPVLQSRRFDPSGGYIRRWLPELAALPDEHIHAPWEAGLSVPGYPSRPRVDHAGAVRRTRLAYRTARLAAQEAH